MAAAAARMALAILILNVIFLLSWSGREVLYESLNPVFLSSQLYTVCVCVCVHAHALPCPSDCVGMRQPSQLEGYLGTCVLRESPRANALGMLHHGHTHKHTHGYYTLEDVALT